jgi:hypothetical protein
MALLPELAVCCGYAGTVLAAAAIVFLETPNAVEFLSFILSVVPIVQLVSTTAAAMDVTFDRIGQFSGLYDACCSAAHLAAVVRTKTDDVPELVDVSVHSISILSFVLELTLFVSASLSSSSFSDETVFIVETFLHMLSIVKFVGEVVQFGRAVAEAVAATSKVAQTAAPSADSPTPSPPSYQPIDQDTSYPITPTSSQAPPITPSVKVGTRHRRRVVRKCNTPPTNYTTQRGRTIVPPDRFGFSSVTTRSVRIIYTKSGRRVNPPFRFSVDVFG